MKINYLKESGIRTQRSRFEFGGKRAYLAAACVRKARVCGADCGWPLQRRLETFTTHTDHTCWMLIRVIVSDQSVQTPNEQNTLRSHSTFCKGQNMLEALHTSFANNVYLVPLSAANLLFWKKTAICYISFGLCSWNTRRVAWKCFETPGFATFCRNRHLDKRWQNFNNGMQVNSFV